MFTRGSRVFFGLAIAGLLGGILYGIITNGIGAGGVIDVVTGKGSVDALLGPISFGYKGGVGDQLGYALFMGFAITMAGMGFTALAFRDGDPEAVAELANATAVPPVAEPNDLSQWPLVTAFALALVTLGLATNPVIFAIGCGALGIAAVEWTVKAWSERATGDPDVNRVIRNRLMYPIEVPAAGFLLIAIIVFAFSRILLTASKTNAVWIAIVIGAVIFGIAVLIGTRPQMRRSLVVGAVLVGGLVAIGLGIFGAIRGERKIEHHEGEGEHAAALVGSDYSNLHLLGETVES